MNTSSIASLVAFPSMPAYAAAKGAVSMMTKLTAAEYASNNIRVNAILPAAIDTAMSENMSGDYRAAFLKATPMKRMGRAIEMANTALFLASDDAAFITGILIPVDGGYTLF